MRAQLLLLLLLSVTSQSCKKYTCECQAYASGNPESGGKTRYTVTKKDRASNCTDRSTTADAFGNYTTCELK